MVAPVPLNAFYGGYSNPIRPDVLAADPDVVLIKQSTIPVELQADLVIQDIGATELIKIIRHDMVVGQRVAYQPIKNIMALATEFNPNTITGFVPTLRGYKNSYAISLDNLLVDDSLTVDNDTIVVRLQGLGADNVIEIAIATPTNDSLLDTL